MTAKYQVKCDDCKQAIRATDDVRESYAGGLCDGCKRQADAAIARVRMHSMLSMLNDPEINPRYACYCIANGAESVEAMSAWDRITWPGGMMCGYILWINEQWREWETETNWRGLSHGEEDQRNFDAWLAETVSHRS